MKKKWISPIVTVAIIICISILAVRHFHIADFGVISDDKLYISGQPKGMDYFRLLYKYHISTIVNLRVSTEHIDTNWHSEELAWTKDNAVNYIELPINKNNYFPDSQSQDKFLSIMSNPENLPLLLHGSGDDERVAMLTAVWLRRAENLPVDKTLLQIKKIIDNRPLNNSEINFITNLK